MKRQRTFTCAHCGADVRLEARACPECGSDDRTGWSKEAYVGDLPTGYDDDPDFDYESVLRAEGLAGRGSGSKAGIRRRWVVAVSVLLAIGFLLWLARY